MPVNIKKDNVKEQKKEIVRFCESCRWHAVAWLGFCCAMLGLVIPFAIVELTDMKEFEANILLLSTTIGGLIAFFWLRPFEIKRADREFKEMNYHSHIHRP